MEETRLEGACGQILQAPQLCCLRANVFVSGKCFPRPGEGEGGSGVLALALLVTGTSGRPVLGC